RNESSCWYRTSKVHLARAGMSFRILLCLLGILRSFCIARFRWAAGLFQRRDDAVFDVLAQRLNLGLTAAPVAVLRAFAAVREFLSIRVVARHLVELFDRTVA